MRDDRLSRRGSGWRSVTGLAISLSATAVVLIATLWPAPQPTSSAAFLCILCGERALVDALVNTALFIPLGIGLWAVGLRPWQAAAIGFGLSLSIEFLQYDIVPGRDASLRDLMTNTFGTALGAYLAGARMTLLRPGPTRAKALAWGTMAIWIMGGGAVAWLLEPEVDPHPAFHGQWAHVFVATEPLQGTIKNVRINNLPAPDGRLSDQVDWPSQFVQSPLRIVVMLEGGLPIGTWAQVFGVKADRSYYVTQLTQRRCDYSYWRRPRAIRWRLNYPTVWLTNACRNAMEEAGELVGTATRSELTIEMTTDRMTQKASLHLSIGTGWMLLRPFEVPWSWYPLLSALWLAVLILPLAYWSSRGWRNIGAVAVPAGTALVVLHILPFVVGLAPTSVWQWGAVLVAITLGWQMGKSRILGNVGSGPIPYGVAS